MFIFLNTYAFPPILPIASLSASHSMCLYSCAYFRYLSKMGWRDATFWLELHARRVMREIEYSMKKVFIRAYAYIFPPLIPLYIYINNNNTLNICINFLFFGLKNGKQVGREVGGREASAKRGVRP